MLQTAFGASCMNRASVFELHKLFKEGRESVRNGERCGRNWLAKGLGLGLGLQCWGFKGFQEEIALVHNSILVTDYLTKMGCNTVPQPPYSQDLAPCDFCLFPKLRGCRYETIEEMKEGHWHTHTRGLPWGLAEVVGTVQQVHCSRRKLLRKGLESCVYYQ